MKNFSFSVAPMLDWTDQYCRFFHRCLSKKTTLYTEMITTGALLFGSPKRHLEQDGLEGVVLQLGGNLPRDLARAAHIATDFGYQAFNINCGCPSDRVQSGQFGACLMHDPDGVAEGVAEIFAQTGIMPSVKCRIGIDEHDENVMLPHFLERVSKSGCHTFIIHARKAWLQGLSPKENREIPPLNYPLVYRMKALFPELTLILNGGLTTLAAAKEHHGPLDGTMIGRAAYHNPWILASVDSEIFGTPPSIQTREEALARFFPYLEKKHQAGVPLPRLLRPLLGLYYGERHARTFRRLFSDTVYREKGDPKWFREKLLLLGIPL